MKRRSSVSKNKIPAVVVDDEKSTQEIAKQSTTTATESSLLQPQVHSELNLFKKQLKMQIHVPKVPVKYIKINMEEDYFEIDTREFSRKFYLKSKYLENIHVSTHDVEVSHNKDRLDIVANVTFISDETKAKYNKIEEQKREARKIKFAPPTQKKAVDERLVKDEKKSERRKRQREKVRFHEMQQDLGTKRRKVM